MIWQKDVETNFPTLGHHTLMHVVSMVIYGIWTLKWMENSQAEEKSLVHSATLRNGFIVWSIQLLRPRLMHLNGEIRLQKDGIFAENEISPIELTEEFFLKNGYAKLYRDNHVTRLYNRNNIGLRVNIYPPENYVRFRVDGIEINYVHEFQHYLRLVKMSDYANNLKI